MQYLTGYHVLVTCYELIISQYYKLFSIFNYNAFSKLHKLPKPKVKVIIIIKRISVKCKNNMLMARDDKQNSFFIVGNFVFFMCVVIR